MKLSTPQYSLDCLDPSYSPSSRHLYTFTDRIRKDARKKKKQIFYLELLIIPYRWRYWIPSVMDPKMQTVGNNVLYAVYSWPQNCSPYDTMETSRRLTPSQYVTSLQMDGMEVTVSLCHGIHINVTCKLLVLLLFVSSLILSVIWMLGYSTQA